ncbi:hypothetical protein [Chroococcus sp. FPU101]|nr:hypothetical protein [Chroococcus sp. FPU101]
MIVLVGVPLRHATARGRTAFVRYLNFSSTHRSSLNREEAVNEREA